MLGYLSLTGRRPEIDGLRPGLANEHQGSTYPVHHLAATALGFDPDHSGHSAVADQQQAQRIRGFPDGYRTIYLIGLGYPTGRCGRSAAPTAGPSTRSCTGITGKTPKAQFRPIWPHQDPCRKPRDVR
jgi:hypothetical protein